MVVPANPWGNATPEEHNAGENADDDPYTSWTVNLELAEFYADVDGPGGVLLRVPVGSPPLGATWNWEWSPDAFGEGEVLMRGFRSGVEVVVR
jgi:hypothetical protein